MKTRGVRNVVDLKDGKTNDAMTELSVSNEGTVASSWSFYVS